MQIRNTVAQLRRERPGCWPRVPARLTPLPATLPLTRDPRRTLKETRPSSTATGRSRGTAAALAVLARNRHRRAFRFAAFSGVQRDLPLLLPVLWRRSRSPGTRCTCGEGEDTEGNASPGTRRPSRGTRGEHTAGDASPGTRRRSRYTCGEATEGDASAGTRCPSSGICGEDSDTGGDASPGTRCKPRCTFGEDTEDGATGASRFSLAASMATPIGPRADRDRDAPVLRQYLGGAGCGIRKHKLALATGAQCECKPGQGLALLAQVTGAQCECKPGKVWHCWHRSQGHNASASRVKVWHCWHRSQVHNASASRVKVWLCWHRSQVPPCHSCQVQLAQQGAVMRCAAPCSPGPVCPPCRKC